jgi:hypothetical protein
VQSVLYGVQTKGWSLDSRMGMSIDLAELYWRNKAGRREIMDGVNIKGGLRRMNSSLASRTCSSSPRVEATNFHTFGDSWRHSSWHSETI